MRERPRICNQPTFQFDKIFIRQFVAGAAYIQYFYQVLNDKSNVNVMSRNAKCLAFALHSRHKKREKSVPEL